MATKVAWILPLYFLGAGELRHKGFDQIDATVVRDGKPKILDDWKKLPH